MRVKDMLGVWDELVLDEHERQAEGELAAAIVERRSVLCDPATEAELAEAEQRLGCRLPKSYRQFLAATNGARADTDGWVTRQQGRPYRDPSWEYGFFPVHLIEPLATADPHLYDLYRNETFGEGPITDDEDEIEDFTPLGGTAIVIGRTGQWLTLLVKVGRAREWQLWKYFGDVGPLGYLSFGSWLESVTSVARLDQVADLIKRTRAGTPKAAVALMKVKDPNALPMLIAALEECRREKIDRASRVAAIIVALGNIGGDEVARAVEPFLLPKSLGFSRGQNPDLPPEEREREYWPRLAAQDLHYVAEKALIQMRSELADDLLAAHECARGLAVRRDPRAAEIIFRDYFTPPRFVGTWQLGALGDPAYLPQLQAAEPLADDMARNDINLVRLKLGDTTVLDYFRKAAADPTHPLRTQAALIVENHLS